MSQDNLIKLTCTNCKRINYYSTKNRRKLTEVKISAKKHCKWCKKHTMHKESKK